MWTARRALKPGGWIELQELRFELGCDDGTVRPDNKLSEFMANVGRGLTVVGVDLLAMMKNKEETIRAGFVSVDEHIFKIPVGDWPRDRKMKTIGLYNRSVVHDALHGSAMKPFTHGLKWTPQEVEVFLISVRRDLFSTSQHGYLPFHAVVGQKPHRSPT